MPVDGVLYVPWRRLLSLMKNNRNKVTMEVDKRVGTDVRSVIPRRVDEDKHTQSLVQAWPSLAR